MQIRWYPIAGINGYCQEDNLKKKKAEMNTHFSPSFHKKTTESWKGALNCEYETIDENFSKAVIYSAVSQRTN